MSDQPPVSDVIELAERFRKAVEKRDAAALTDLIETYQSIYEKLQDKITLLTDKISTMPKLTEKSLRELDRFKELLRQVSAELESYQNYVGIQIRKLATEEITAGMSDAKRLVRALGGDPAIVAQWNNINPEVIKTLLGFLQEDGALYQRLSQLAPYTVERIKRALLDNIGIGKNPKAIAKIIEREMGMALTDALRMTRTVQIYTYREANRASYIANSDVVEGWYWMSALDDESCTSCIAMHGTFHTLDETLDDHHNGLCAMLPAVIGAKSPLDKTGEEWFKELPESKQREYMGDAKYDAWKDGKFEFSTLSKQHDDDVYGTMRGETPLKELIGDG